MGDERVPTYLAVEGVIRSCQTANIPIFVVHKGNRTGGLVLLKFNNLKGDFKVLVQQRGLNGKLQWINPLNDLVTEKEADGYIADELNFDSDLWVLEIEDKEMRNPFEF